MNFPIEPHPYLCQVEGCKHLGQEIIDFHEKGKMRVCLYHYVVLMIPAVKQDGRKISQS